MALPEPQPGPRRGAALGCPNGERLRGAVPRAGRPLPTLRAGRALPSSSSPPSVCPSLLLLLLLLPASAPSPAAGPGRAGALDVSRRRLAAGR